MHYLKQFIRSHKLNLIVIFALLIGQVIGTLYIPFLIADMIDVGIMQENIDAIVRIGIQMFIVALVCGGISIWGSYLCAQFAAAFGCDMRAALFKKTQAFSLMDIDAIEKSSLITRTTSDITTMQQTIIMVLQMIITAPMIAIAAIIMTAQVNATLTWILIATIIIFLFGALLILQKTQPLSSQLQAQMDKINRVVRESIVGIRVIRAFDKGSYEKQRSDATFETYAQTMISINRKFAILNPLIWLMIGIAMAVIIGVGGYYVGYGEMAIGEITSISEYMIMTLGYLIMACFSIVTLPKMRVCLQRLEEVLNREESIRDNSQTLALKEPIKELIFDHVSFTYDGAQLPVLHNLSFQCLAGQTTAIIGGTGSGKSTIASLILRLHDIDAGNLYFNDVDIRDMAQHDVREHVAYVPQKAFLFSGSIIDNLKMGKENASIYDIQRALRIAQADTFVLHLPDQSNAAVSQSGKNFSGGQKQRLAIARALIKEADVLVFDDSFSALDFKTDAALRKCLKEEVTNTIQIIIAQRISTIQDADQIIVIDEGRIVGIGKHDALLKSCDVYQEIAKSQMPRGKEEMAHE